MRLQKLLEVDNRYRKDLIQRNMFKDEGVIQPQRGVVIQIQGQIKKGGLISSTQSYSKFNKSMLRP